VFQEKALPEELKFLFKISTQIFNARAKTDFAWVFISFIGASAIKASILYLIYTFTE
jgi:hypothetical protein